MTDAGKPEDTTLETVIRDYGGQPKLIAAGTKRWSAKSEAAFLDHLALSCNVTAAAKAVNFSTQAAYRHRRRSPSFAQRWREALELGYARLEEALVEGAITRLTGDDVRSDGQLLPATFSEALNLLRLHHSFVKEGVLRPGRPRREKPIEEVRASIARKLDAIERARGQA